MSNAAALQRFLVDNIPLCRAMALTVRELDDHHAVLDAPLAPNVNDKGTAFGGSLCALATLTGWGLLWSRIDGGREQFDIMIRDTALRYRRPVVHQLTASCAVTPAAWDDFAAALEARGRARLELEVSISDHEGLPAMEMTGTYVARRRPPEADRNTD